MEVGPCNGLADIEIQIEFCSSIGVIDFHMFFLGIIYLIKHFYSFPIKLADLKLVLAVFWMFCIGHNSH